MTKDEYLQKYFPKDFIKIDDDIFIIPAGFELSVNIKEIGNTLTTADGTKRKDIILKKEQATFKYNTTTQTGYEALQQIVEKIENANYKTEKTLFIKKQNMKNTNNIYSDFKTIKIDIIELSKYNYKFRQNNFFVYANITLKIN